MNRLKDTVLKPVGDQFDRLTELILRQLSITRQLLAGNSSAELRDELNRNESAIDGPEVSIRDEVVTTALTRNQVTGNRPWVRIPPAPPLTRLKRRFQAGFRMSGAIRNRRGSKLRG